MKIYNYKYIQQNIQNKNSQKQGIDYKIAVMSSVCTLQNKIFLSVTKNLNSIMYKFSMTNFFKIYLGTIYLISILKYIKNPVSLLKQLLINIITKEKI